MTLTELKKENKRLKELLKSNEEYYAKLRDELLTHQAQSVLLQGELNKKDFTSDIKIKEVKVIEKTVPIDKVKLSQAILRMAKIFLDVDLCEAVVKDYNRL